MAKNSQCGWDILRWDLHLGHRETSFLKLECLLFFQDRSAFTFKMPRSHLLEWGASRFLARQDRSTDSLLVDTGPLLNFMCFVTAIKQGHSPTFHPFPPLYWLLLLGQKELASFSNREPLTLVFCSGNFNTRLWRGCVRIGPRLLCA